MSLRQGLPGRFAPSVLSLDYAPAPMFIIVDEQSPGSGERLISISIAFRTAQVRSTAYEDLVCGVRTNAS